MKYFLGLGSNLGNPEGNIRQAIAALEKRGVKISTSSSLYRTEPVGFVDQPWFLNQVVEAEADLTPYELLQAAKDIETTMGRRPSARNAPRIIDIDILMAENAVIRTGDLVVPPPN
jgi:2-amino-4-hydroxy-6-hydroxymethyldihydropteridine diphosphokinase